MSDDDETRTMRAVPEAADEADAWPETWPDEEVEEPNDDGAFEIHRRAGVYGALAATCLVLAAGFVAAAALRQDVVLWGAAAVLALVGLYVGRGVLDARTPLFVADAHGVRMRDGAGWVGLLWSEMADIRVEDRDGRLDPRIKVVSPDGQHIYTAPLGFATTASVREARDHLAARRPTGGY